MAFVNQPANIKKILSESTALNADKLGNQLPVHYATAQSVPDAIQATLANIRLSKLNNPLVHLFKKNKLAETLSGNISITRSTIATYVDLNDVVRTAGIDTPREEKNGFLFEGLSTNLCLYSDDFSNAQWVKSNVSATANKLVENTVNAAHHLTQTVAVTNNSVVTLSVIVKAAGRTRLRFLENGGSGANGRFNLLTGVVDSQTNAVISARMIKLNDSYFRCEMTLQANGPFVQIRFALDNGATDSYLGDGVSGILIKKAQVEESTFATSPISTTGASATRVADDVSFSALENFRESKGCVFVKASTSDANIESKYILTINHIDHRNMIRLFFSGGKIMLQVFKDGSTEVSLRTEYDYDINTEYSISVNYSLDSVELFVDGVRIGSDIKLNFPALLTTVWCGRYFQSGNELKGHIQDLRFYDENLTLDEIKLLGGE